MHDWKDDLARSNCAFLNVVWPEISVACGGGEISQVDISEKSKIECKLDMSCGIDFLQTTETGCKGIAVRVQFGCVDWGTFTIRKERFSGAKTEFQKRTQAIKSDGEIIYPHITIHAYVSGQDDSELVNAYVAKTKNIFSAISEGKYEVKSTTNASFFCVRHSDVKGCFSWWRDEKIAKLPWKNENCDHQWVEINEGRSIKTECRKCKKFYGRRPIRT